MSASFLRPELLALFLPLAWLAWSTRRDQHPVTTGLRLAMAAIVTLAVAGLYLKTGSSGRHVAFVVDRSASMPQGAEAQAIELIDLALEARRAEDEVHVVTFGETSQLHPALAQGSRGFQAFEGDVGRDGSDLAAGLESALSLIPKGTHGSIVLVSDGQADAEREVEGAVLAAASRGIRIDVRGIERRRVADTAVERIEMPSEVFAGEPFLITSWIHSSTRETRSVRLLRGEKTIETRTVELPPGRSRLSFRTILGDTGIGTYRVELLPTASGSADRIPENDRAVAATRALGARPVLIINHDGATDALVQALRGAGIPAVPITVEKAPYNLATLDAFRAVVLENVPASRLGLKRMELLRSWTLDHGGGLLMTGGPASFGSGGYFRSPLDDLLPVSMEQRQEHRKLAVALSVTLDRSGSMSAPADGGTKMDLANRGTVEALRLLSPNDSASIIAVDSSAHVIQEQTQLTHFSAVEAKVLGIQSQGGGIFTATALQASAQQLRDAPETTKHVILFADARDAEEQEATPPVIELLRAMGATVSVIGLGSEKDQHAGFLRDCAAMGGGEAYFTESATELPRLFAMDTQAVARSTFVEEPTPVHGRPDLLGLGELASQEFPGVGGYNLTYLREGASLGAVTVDEYKAPVFAFHARGLGRVAAFTGQVGGQYGSALPTWDGFSPFFVTLSRWLSGVEPPEGVFTSVHREGRNAVLSVEFDPELGSTDLGESLDATINGVRGPEGLTLERVGPTRFEARYPLSSGEVALTTVRLTNGEEGPIAIPLPPVALPYSPEYERSPDPRAGDRLLRRIASRSGGVVNVATADVFRGSRTGQRWRLFLRELMLLALGLLMLEIAGRRLDLWEGVRLPQGLWIAAAVSKRRKARAATPSATTTDPKGADSPAPTPSSPTDRAADRPPETTTSDAGADAVGGATSLADTLAAARRSSRGRLDRE